jgi:uncharacterized protein (TIGR00369 family)
LTFDPDFERAMFDVPGGRRNQFGNFPARHAASLWNVDVDVNVKYPRDQPTKGRRSVVPAISVAEFNEIIRADLTWAYDMGMHADVIGEGTAMLRLPYRESMLRPGGVIAGPMMMALADACMFAVALSLIGEVKLAVTTSFNINFLHRASPGDLLAEGRILKSGKRLVVCEVTIHSEGHDRPVAHATGTYSIPPV